MSGSLQLHRLQHARFPCPSLCPTVYSDSCPLNRWQYLTILSSATPFFSYLQSFPESVFSSESALCIKWSKYWSFSFTKSQTKLKWLSCFMHARSFSISPSNENLGLISFRIDLFDLLDVQGTLKSFSRGEEPRWWRNRMRRPLSPLQIHWKNNWTQSKLHKTTSDR